MGFNFTFYLNPPFFSFSHNVFTLFLITFSHLYFSCCLPDNFLLAMRSFDEAGRSCCWSLLKKNFLSHVSVFFFAKVILPYENVFISVLNLTVFLSYSW